MLLLSDCTFFKLFFHIFSTIIEAFVNDRIITVRLKTNRGHITIIGVYAPEEGREEETRRFYKQLQKEVDKYNKSDSLIISGDLNARVGNQPILDVVGTFAEDCVNRNGQTLRICILQRFQNCQHIFQEKKNKFTNIHGVFEDLKLLLTIL